MDSFPRREQFLRARQRLLEGLAEYAATQSQVVRDGVIQRFEFTADQARKALEERLKADGCPDPLLTPKAVIRQASAAGLVKDQEGWLQLLGDRNITSHLYSEATADQVFSRIQGTHLPLLDALAAVLARE